MCITLPWYIEPNGTAQVTESKFSDPSHRLRFDMKRPTERLEAFRARINAAAETSEAVSAASGSDKNWLLGYRQRHKGSLHQDIWRGTAGELRLPRRLPGPGLMENTTFFKTHDSEA
ncbi:TPA: hypothetical protein ONC18_004123 [Enterobacter kobei]|nr:hypothetical protein [Enterobacter asburiae]HCR1911370.1 hypothetical protein [Enterobacter kobei]